MVVTAYAQAQQLNVTITVYAQPPQLVAAQYAWSPVSLSTHVTHATFSVITQALLDYTVVHQRVRIRADTQVYFVDIG